jgi:hypothetical protein
MSASSPPSRAGWPGCARGAGLRRGVGQPGGAAHPAGAAQYFASAIDRVGWASILGTIAGDDTVLLITRRPLEGRRWRIAS